MSTYVLFNIIWIRVTFNINSSSGSLAVQLTLLLLRVLLSLRAREIPFVGKITVTIYEHKVYIIEYYI